MRVQVKQHIFGVIFCMSSVQSDFSDVSPRLRELCEVMSSHLLFSLSHALKEEYKVCARVRLSVKLLLVDDSGPVYQ